MGHPDRHQPHRCLADDEAALPHIIAGGRGGSIIAISSIAGIRGVPHVAHYSAAKHALVGLVGSVANEVAPHNIRVNTVHPTNVRTDMIDNPTAAKIFRPDLEDPTRRRYRRARADQPASGAVGGLLRHLRGRPVAGQ